MFYYFVGIRQASQSAYGFKNKLNRHPKAHALTHYISLAALLALYGAFDYNLPAALNGPQLITKSVLDNPFIAGNGFIKVPTDPGLGIDVNEDKIRESKIEVDLD